MRNRGMPDGRAVIFQTSHKTAIYGIDFWRSKGLAELLRYVLSGAAVRLVPIP